MNKQEMTEAIRQAIKCSGVAVINDRTQLCRLLGDFLPGDSRKRKKERNTLLYALDVGEWKQLLSAHDSGQTERERVTKVVLTALKDAHDWPQEKAEMVIECYTNALGWSDVTVATASVSDVTVVPAPSQLPQNTLVLDDETRESVPLIETQEQRNIVPKQYEKAFVKGAIVTFGKYKWRVLYIRGNSALLITDEITDIGIPYEKDENLEGTSWEECYLRKWLNTEFLKRFSNEQKKKILKRPVYAERNPWFHTEAGKPTEDKVFLLSISEVVQNFGDSGHLKTRPENSWTYESDNMSYAIDDRFNTARQAAYKGENTWWWLRSPGDSKVKAAFANPDGLIFLQGELAFDNGGTSCVGVRPGVRPAIWLQQ